MEQQMPTDLEALTDRVATHECDGEQPQRDDNIAQARNEFVDHIYNIIPPRGESDYVALLADTKNYGQREEIVLREGKLLLGRDQLRACEEAGIEPRIDTYEGGYPLGLVARAANGRYLDESQRAMATGRAETIRHGGDRKSVQDSILILDRSRLALLFNVSKGSVASAARVLAHGDPELIRAVDQGRISVSAAAKATKTLASDLQQEVAKLALAGEKKAAREIIDSHKAPKAGNSWTALGGAYGLVLVDLQRSFSEHSPPAADDLYPDLGLKKIKDTIALQAARDSVVLAWTSPPRLAQSIDAMRSWGWQYQSHCVWPTDAQKTGCWFLNRHELLLLGTRGNPPEPKSPWPSLIQAPAANGSSTPDEFFAMIEQSYPTLRKIELDRQGPSREGWEYMDRI